MKQFAARALLALGLLFPAPLAAQDYPSKPIRIIVPFAAGGPADMIARAIAPTMSATLKQTVVIENKAGAGGAVGVDTVAKSPPDGYTIGLSGPGALVSVPFMTSVPYNVERDIAPIARIATVSGVIAAGPKTGFKSLADLIAYAKERPGQVNFGSAGSGTTTHLAGELLNMEAGIKLVHVPYRGAAPAIQDLVAGHVSLLFDIVPLARTQIAAGKVRALAVASPQRLEGLPDVPTMAEAGFPELEGGPWFGLLAPAGTPRAIIDLLNAETRKAFAAPDVRDRFLSQGMTLPLGTPEEFAAFIAAESIRWGDIVRKTGIRMD
jgi:tripartite-type tricarboxylate transporter receptor subunit TctC